MYSENEPKSKLDWMYKGANSMVDREEYLLGRKIDKTLEQINEEEKHKELGIVQPKNHVEHECIPPSIRDYKLQLGDQVDLATKLQEDPLVLIKKREEESRRQFLQNPIQLKKLQAALSKHPKKNRKKVKLSKQVSSSEDDIDQKIAEKLKSLKSNSFKIQEGNYDLDLILLHKLTKMKNKLSRSDVKQILQCTQSIPSSGGEESDGSADSDIIRNERMRIKNFKTGMRKYSDKNRIDTKRQETATNISKYAQISKFNKTDQRESSRNNYTQKKPLSEMEKERIRREMMENASWRDQERSNNLKRYREEDAKEKSSVGEYKTDFIHKELLKSANSSSLESRIKSNINSIQRGGNDMNTHFSRRH